MPTPVTHVSQLDPNTTYSYADYYNWQFEERVELIDGKVFKMVSSPGTLHQRISGKLSLKLSAYFKSHHLAVFFAPFDVRLPEKNQSSADEDIRSVVQPDICVCDESKLDDRGCVGAPELVVEILLPNNSKTELDDKFDLYQCSGVSEYWIVQPAYQNVLLFTRGSGDVYVGLKPATEELRSVQFPGLTIDMKEIFN